MAHSGYYKHKPPRKDLIDLVFSWTLEDISNDELYKEQVEKIPECFQSVEDYLGSFTLPLIEETRAELFSSMQVLHDAPFAEVISVKESVPHGSFLYELKFDSWRNIDSGSGKEPYSPKCGDLFVLSDVVPEIASDLEQCVRTCTFALVMKDMKESNAAEDDKISSYLEFRTSKLVEAKDGMRNSVFAVFLVNMTTKNRIWKALHMSGNLQIIKEVLCSNSMVEEICNLCSLQDEQLVHRLSLVLDESQATAVCSSVSVALCNHKSSIKLIWGPPGTGKTKTLSILMYTLLSKSCRTLACAPTNVAVKELALRVLKLVKDPYHLDLGQDELCSLGDLLLFGSRNRLEIFDELEEIYLDNRVNRLVECFMPQNSWKSYFKTMIKFLEGCVAEYRLLENESVGEAKTSVNNDSTPVVPSSFLGFIKNRYSAIVSPLKRCVSDLCTHLPRRLLLQHNFESIVGLLHLLDSFGSLLSQSNASDKEIETLFAQGEVFDSYHKHESEAYMSSTSAQLYKMRNECIDALRSLCHSLSHVLPDSMNRSLVWQFCFQSASLIFCTASSSYTLHRVEMDPLNLLVIDEAAQLRECESAIPMQLKGIRHAILIGDECQLPAMVTSKVSDDAGFGRSLFERLSSLGHSKHLLNIQYRMHPKISAFPNANFYENKILDAPNVLSKNYERHYLQGPMFGPYSFISTSDGRDEQDNVAHSRRNMVEVAIILKIVRKLFRAWDGAREKLTIGIISPYAAQVAAIQEKLGHKYEKLEYFAVRVKSIDGFQGGEEDIMIISTVRSNSEGSVGFLSNLQRTNVALTRARRCLWVLGDGKTLLRSGSCWSALVSDARDRHCLFNVGEDKDLAEAALKTKKDFDQLDDLLNGDSILFKTAKWKVLFSDNFRKSFARLKSFQARKSVINLLLKLSNGWSPKKLNSVCENSFQLVKQFKVGRLYVISAVDIMKYSSYVQVLKIWDILPLEEMPKLVKRLDNIFSMYTDDFINRCKEKNADGDMEVPVIWEPCNEVVRYNARTKLYNGSSVEEFDERSYLENSKVNESLLLMKFYSLSSGVVRHLLSGSDGRELDLPFEMTDQELEITLFPRSSFILGRSGTGKTTILTMKLFRKEQQHYFSSEGLSDGPSSASASPKNWMTEGLGETKGTVLRQMFVTVSPQLCSAIKNQISNLKSFICGKESSVENKSMDMHDIDDASEFSSIPDSFMDLPLDCYPLVITFQKFLLMLDGSMENSYFDRFNDVKEFCAGNTGTTQAFALNAFIRSKEVTYDRFKSFYWPHFNCHLTRKLDSSTVFVEIMSHIKGGLIAGRVPNGKLSRGNYLLLSEGRVSTLSKDIREMIYDIFLDYEKKKLLNGEFDFADLVMDLHRRLRQGIYLGDQMDFVYIDEVQDLTMRQAALFKYICHNFEEGFVFSGDTAQTIARGIEFRFQDIRSLFYNEFITEQRSDIKGNSKENLHCSVSDYFQLNQNFRTHAGVLKLSQSVIELLYHFFPLSIDSLVPENSLIYGEPPVLLESVNDENAIVTIFGNSGSTGSSLIGFGAEQVILVRDDSVKKEVSDQIGKQALVLTIVECKGLEFQDVLLYNFFGTSPLKNQWRVIYGYMEELDLFHCTEHKSFPSFCSSKHKILCSELKQLYVALTRARQRLWIYESMDKFSVPVFDYWKKLGVVQVRHLDESLAQTMRVGSSKEEWCSRGIKLFNEGNFEMATMCFERAGDSYKEKWAKAAGLRAAANRMGGLNSELARVPLTEAAEIFETIGKFEIAAKCFIQLKEFERAGLLYLKSCEESRLEDAADCFSLAGCWSIAAEMYCKANCLLKCLTVCTKGNLFEVGLQFLEKWKSDGMLDADAAENQKLKELKQEFLEKCAFHYHQVKDTNSMMKFVRAFNSLNLMRTFLVTHSYLDELVVLEIEFGNCMEAANSAKLRGDLLRGAEILEKGGYYEEASRIILMYVLANSLWITGSKGWPLKKFSNKEELLTKSKLIAKTRNDNFYELICVEVSSLSEKDSSLEEMGDCLATSQRLGHLGAEILYLRKILDSHLKVRLAKYEQDEMVVLDSMKHAALMISHKRVSAQTLNYFWNTWREKILSILVYLGSIGTIHEKDYKGCEEFCLGYLGVCKAIQNGSSIYILLNADAYWMKDVCHKRNGELVTMDAHQFVSAAQSYWVSELTSLGMIVLEKLNTLYRFYVGKSPSMFNQGMTSLHIFEVTKGLMQPKVLNWEAPKALLEYSASSRQRFFEMVCPPDSKMIFSEDMMKLRKTELCREITKEVIMELISSERKLSLGQIWKVVMLVFVCGSLPVELYQVIVNRFDLSPHWKSFFEQFKDCLDSGIVRLSFLLQIRESLRETRQPNWSEMSSYISPFHFSYLLERFLYLTSSWKRIFFTTKASLLETLACENWKLNSKSESDTDASLKAELYALEGFLVDFSQHILSGRKGTLKWFDKTDIAAKKDYPSLVLRLCILVCLVCINAGDHFGVLCDLLVTDDISYFLPLEFREIGLAISPNNPYEIISSAVDSNKLYRVCAEVLKVIENPLVILYLDKNRPTFPCPDAIFIDMELIICREDILDILNLKRTQCVQQDAVIELETKGLSESINHCSQPSSSFGEEGQFMENEGKHVNDLQGGYKMVPVPVNGGVSFDPHVLKFNLELLIRTLDAAIAKSNLNASSTAEDRRFVTEAEIMLGELKQILIALRVSCPREESMQPILNRVFALFQKWEAKSMGARLSKMSAPFFSMLMVQSTAQASVSLKGKKKKENQDQRRIRRGKAKGSNILNQGQCFTFCSSTLPIVCIVESSVCYQVLRSS
ncbi:hypothetical protein MKW92_003170 [Papaver armeniacum]|nr:hypothetical protein MKW92_003170 [Papaver armeniacum]